ncbi:MAG: c-type cytochrome [Planctomycetes bacterium]|nr:c-type cytochrome [Planctomycetota bacterium]
MSSGIVRRAAPGLWLAAALLLGTALPAQQGDRTGEVQTLLPDDVEVPPAPVLTPEQARAAFVLAPGFRIELVASEPLLGDPVQAVFDARGWLWVVEMRGYMTDLAASAERQPTGCIAVLRDRDGDGRMDERQVFLDGLVLPRAVLPLREGVLVLTPPELAYYPFAADGRTPGPRQRVLAGFEAGLDNPEHSGNGLLWARDGRIHLANDKRLLRWTPAGFQTEAGAGGGQWGIAQDDRGRVSFNYNEDWLRTDLVPGRYAPQFGATTLPGLNHRVVDDRSVWPVRRTPGVNRGYQKGRLRDYVLAEHTAVCAPLVYRGALLPGCRDDRFVCEPAGLCVRRIHCTDQDGALRGANVYQQQRAEFLASHDERFRPVNLCEGADGALYVVDLYRGVIQHKNFLTSYLRQQIERRGLAQPTGLGRIWRILPAEGPAPVRPAPLHEARSDALLAALQGPSGAAADLALVELVQREAHDQAPALAELARSAQHPGARIAAFSALAQLGDLTNTELRAALADADPGVVALALQHAAPFLLRGDLLAWTAVERVAHGTPNLAWHAVLCLGEVLRAAPVPRWRARAVRTGAELLLQRGDDATLRGLAAAALLPAAPEVLARLTAAEPLAPALAAGRELAQALVRAKQEPALVALFAKVAEATPAWQEALLEGAVRALPRPEQRAGWLPLSAVPQALVGLAQQESVVVGAAARAVLAAIALPAVTPPPADRPVPPEVRAQLGRGQRTFAAVCAACHQPDGSGMAGLAPPLLDAALLAGSPAALVRLALHGLRGPLQVGGATWSLEMPGQQHLGDEDLAAVLSFARWTFARGAEPIGADVVAKVRAETKQRGEPWTVAELEAFAGEARK